MVGLKQIVTGKKKVKATMEKMGYGHVNDMKAKEALSMLKEKSSTGVVEADAAGESTLLIKRWLLCNPNINQYMYIREKVTI